MAILQPVIDRVKVASANAQGMAVDELFGGVNESGMYDVGIDRLERV